MSSNPPSPRSVDNKTFPWPTSLSLHSQSIVNVALDALACSGELSFYSFRTLSSPSSPHPLISPTLPMKLQHTNIGRCTHTLTLTLPIHFAHIPTYHPKNRTIQPSGTRFSLR